MSSGVKTLNSVWELPVHIEDDADTLVFRRSTFFGVDCHPAPLPADKPLPPPPPAFGMVPGEPATGVFAKVPEGAVTVATRKRPA